MSEWIKTNEELPNDKELILFFTDEKVRIGIYRNADFDTLSDLSFQEIDTVYAPSLNLFNKDAVKFWQRMPLPPAPSEE